MYVSHDLSVRDGKELGFGFPVGQLVVTFIYVAWNSYEKAQASG